jgi:hypothetical protein
MVERVIFDRGGASVSRRVLLLALVLVAALTVSVSIAVAGPGGGIGNSPAANSCKNGGWTNLVRADQTPFADQGECLSYVTAGGIPASPSGQYPVSAAYCQAAGGTFAIPGTNLAGPPSPSTAVLVWTCNGWPSTYSPPFAQWGIYCAADVSPALWAMTFTSNSAYPNTGISCFRQV